jgi:hypothetical protein
MPTKQLFLKKINNFSNLYWCAKAFDVWHGKCFFEVKKKARADDGNTMSLFKRSKGGLL